MGEIDVLPSDFSFFFYFQFRQVLAKGQDLYTKLKEHSCRRSPKYAASSIVI